AVKKPSPKPRAVPAQPAPEPVIVERIEEVYSTPEETIVVETVVIADNDLPETGTEAAADAKEDEQGNPALF
ncbi:MAG TPA: hypothetical protein PLZ10_10415, partial [Chitinophagaceae bacterium]|nr:hypothetical protein [Chitinophagaceae bacterium]